LLAKSYEVVHAIPRRSLSPGASSWDYIKLSLHLYVGPKGYLVQLVGMFGRSWFPARPITLVCWAAAAALVILPALLLAQWRIRMLLIAIVLVGFLASTGIPVSQAYHLGLAWHSRYVLPLLVGLPLLAGLSLERTMSKMSSELVIPGVFFAATGTLYAWFFVLHRFVVGQKGPLNVFASVPGRWSPPIALWLLIPAVVIFQLWVVLLVIWPKRSRAPRHARRSGFSPLGRGARST
jgi:hypothetical protein